MIEVCGFNSESVNIYVDNYFVNKPMTAQIVKQKIDESENLTVMASIPVYTWVICSIFNEDINIESPRTTTHLCSYACLLFIRNHIKEISGYSFSSNSPLREIICNEGVLQVILCLGELSQSTLKHKKVAFSKEDLNKFPIELETTGFIVKDQRSKIYQFRHLVLQEYFAALYMYLKSDFTQVFHENNYRSCIPFIAGFSGIEIVDTNDPITLLIKKLKGQSSSRNKLKRLLPRFIYRARTIAPPSKIVVQNWLNSEFEDLIYFNKMYLGGASLLLAAFYECQGEISSELRERLIICSVQLVGYFFHHDIRNAMYLFTKLNITNISKIYIMMISKKKYSKNMVDLLKLYLDTRTNKILHLKGGEEMELHADYTEPITIQLSNNDNNVETHSEFLLSTISLVSTIELSYSLDNMYPFVRDLLKENKIIKNEIYDSSLPTAPTPFHIKMFSDSILMSQHGDKSNINIDLPCKQLTDAHIANLQPCIPYADNLNLSMNSEMSSQSMKCLSDSIMKTIEINNTCNIKLIDISYCNLVDEHIESLQPCIPYLEDLQLSGNSKMSPQAMRYISDSAIKVIEINNTYNLKVINFGHCNLTDEHIECLQPCIPYLEDLHMSGNSKMSSQAMRYISDSIMKAIELNNTCHLKFLKLSYCFLTDEHIESLQPCIPYLENLDISHNLRMSSQAMKFISDSVMKAIKINNTCHLKLINIRDCNLTYKHIECLQSCIPYLENIHMSGNSKMSSQAMKHISDSVMKEIEINNTCNLKSISLRNCNLTDEHIESLQSCIPYLEDLDISYNSKMSSEAMKYISDSIIEAIEINNTCNIKLINLRHCNLTDEHIKSLQPCIQYLENLDMDDHYVFCTAKT